MKNNALRSAGVIFIIMAGAQLVRFVMRVDIVAGTVHIPVWISGAAFAVLIGLAAWMFKAVANS